MGGGGRGRGAVTLLDKVGQVVHATGKAVFLGAVSRREALRPLGIGGALEARDRHTWAAASRQGGGGRQRER